MSDERLIRQLQKALSEAEVERLRLVEELKRSIERTATVRAEVVSEREACAVLVESDRLHGNDRLAAAIRDRGAK